MSASVESFYDALGVYLPSGGATNRSVRCFAARDRHKHGDRQKSCMVNVGNGAWQCHGCGEKGGCYDAAIALGFAPRDAMSLLERYGLVDGDGRRAAVDVAPTPFGVSDADVAAWHARLAENGAAVERLRVLRGWSVDAIERLQLGVDGAKVTIPYRDERGKLIGLARYQPNPERRVGSKMKAEAGSRRDLWPAPESLSVSAAPVVLVEGEPDCARAWSVGFDAVCVPGANAWRGGDAAKRFAGRHVVILPDCDVAGRAAALLMAADLLPHVSAVQVGEFDPQRMDGFDLSDATRGMDAEAAAWVVGNAISRGWWARGGASGNDGR